jgi:hypothetical protein
MLVHQLTDHAVHCFLREHCIAHLSAGETSEKICESIERCRGIAARAGTRRARISSYPHHRRTAAAEAGKHVVEEIVDVFGLLVERLRPSGVPW